MLLPRDSPVGRSIFAISSRIRSVGERERAEQIDKKSSRIRGPNETEATGIVVYGLDFEPTRRNLIGNGCIDASEIIIDGSIVYYQVDLCFGLPRSQSPEVE